VLESGTSQDLSGPIMGLRYLYKDEISGVGGTYGGATNACRDLVGRAEGRPLGRHRRRWESCIKDDPA
jgi:hypothetical protein